MKFAATLMSLGLTLSSLSAYAQSGEQKPDASAQVPAAIQAGSPSAIAASATPAEATPAGSAMPVPATPDPTPAATAPADAAGSALSVPATPSATTAPAIDATAVPTATVQAATVQAPSVPAPASTTPASAPTTEPASVGATADAKPAAGAPVPTLDLDPNYILGTDDAIMVHVWKEPTISGSLVIRPDGRISLPLVGDMPAAGMTPMALAAEIQDGLKKFINDPSVTVTVTAVNSRKIFFIGEVLRSGPVPLTRSMTMLQAISAAGGLSPYANKKKIYILREEKGKQVKIPFDYSKALKEGNQQGVELKPGDTIVVP